MAKIEEKITITAEDNASAMFKQLANNINVLTGKIDENTKSFQRTKRSVDSSVLSFNALKATLASLGVGLTVNAVKDLVDSFTLLKNRVSVSTSSLEELKSSLDELRDLSNRTGTSLENNAVLFQRLGIASKSLGATNKDMLKLTETVANLGRISGSSVEDMKNATRQFAQTMSQSNLRAEEFNSVVEQIPALIKEVSFEMGYMQSEFGIAVREGKILSKDVYEALLRAQERVNEQASKLPFTIGQAGQAIKNDLILELGRLDEQLGASAGLAGFLKSVSENMDTTKQVIGGVTIALGGMAGAWALVALQAKYAAVRAAGFVFAVNPVVGIVALLGATLGASAVEMALFGRESRSASESIFQLSTAMSNMHVEAATQSLGNMRNELAEVNLSLIAAKSEMDALKDSIASSPDNGGFSGFDLAKQQTELKAVEKLHGRLTETAKNYSDEIVRSEEALKRLNSFNEKRTARLSSEGSDKEAEKALKAYEGMRKELEDQAILAVERFEANNRLINQQANKDVELTARLKQNNAIKLRDTLERIDAEKNAETIKEQEKYDRFLTSISSEREQLTKWLEEKKELINKFEGEDSIEGKLALLQEEYDRKLEVVERNEEAIAAAKKRKRDKEIEDEVKGTGQHKQFLAEQLKLDFKTNEGKMKSAKQTSTYLLDNASKYSKKAFEVNKAFQTGQAIVEGYAAVQKALAAFPPPFNFAAAAAVAVATGAQIRGIQSATFGGGGGTPSVSGGASAGSVPQNSTAAPVEQFNQNISINLEGVEDDGIYSGKTIRKITEEIAKQTENGITNVRFA